MESFLRIECDILLYCFRFISSPRDLQALATASRGLQVLVNLYVDTAVRDYQAKYELMFCLVKRRNTRIAYFLIAQPRIFIIGGSLNSRQCDKFDPYTCIINKCSSLGRKRTDESASVLHNGVVMTLSGREVGSVGSIEWYNLISGEWKDGPTLPSPLVAPSATSMAGNLYLIGGCDSVNSERTHNIYMLNQRVFERVLESGNDTPHAWILCQRRLLVGRSHHASVAHKNVIWIAGGVADGQTGVTNTVETFDPDTQSVVAAPPMARCRLRPHLLVIGDTLFAVGGDVNGLTAARGTIEQFDCASHRWRVVTEYPVKRSKSAVCAHQDRIYVFGGSDGAQNHLTWDYYDVTKQAWASQMGIACIGAKAADGSEGEAHKFSMLPARPSGLLNAMAISVSL